MQPTRSDRLRGLSINRMIPNILTLLALSAGLTAIRFAMQERWEHACLAIVVAAILDGLDGRIARILKGASRFGAELDSLSDFISFGVAPVIVLYLWTLHTAADAGWIVVLLYSVCCALRLARFNTHLDEPDRPAWRSNYFTGVPSPAGAGLVLMPMFLAFQVGETLFSSPEFVTFVVIAVALLLVSPLPTFAFKRVRIPHRWVLPVMLAVGTFTAFLISAPWLTMTLSGLLYLASIPVSVRRFRQTQASLPVAPPPPAAPGA